MALQPPYNNPQIIQNTSLDMIIFKPPIRINLLCLWGDSVLLELNICFINVHIIVCFCFFYTNNCIWPHLQIVQELKMAPLRCNFLHSMCQLHRAPATSGPMMTRNSSWGPRSLCDATNQVDLCLSVSPSKKEKTKSIGQTTFWLNMNQKVCVGGGGFPDILERHTLVQKGSIRTQSMAVFDQSTLFNYWYILFCVNHTCF